MVNIKDAYKDHRFNSEIDHRTGYKTNIILSMPICNYEEEVIGVAQIINKTNGEEVMITGGMFINNCFLLFKDKKSLRIVT